MTKTITYTNTRMDVFRFMLYTLMRMRIIWGVLLVGLFPISLSIVGNLPAESTTSTKLITLVAILCLVIGSILIVFLLFLFLYAMVFSQKTFLCEHTVNLHEESIIEETVFNKSEHGWTGLTRISKTNHYLYIYVTGNSGHVIPRRAFSSEKEWNAFFKLCEAQFNRTR